MYFGDLQWIFAWQRDQASLPPLLEFDPVSFLPLGGQWPEPGLLRKVWHMAQHSLYHTEHRVRLQRGKGEMNCWNERQPWFFFMKLEWELVDFTMRLLSVDLKQSIGCQSVSVRFAFFSLLSIDCLTKWLILIIFIVALILFLLENFSKLDS